MDSFSTDEATMLLLGSKLVADHFDAQYGEVSQSARRKIEAVLSEKMRGEVSYLRESIAFVAPQTFASGASAKFLPTIRRAIIERKTIQFHYHTRYSMDRSQAKKTRKPPMKAYPNLPKEDLDGLVAYLHSLKG